MIQAGDKLPLPLDGIRVLDATHIVAGPFCSMILADMGADVIKIERPGTGDLVRNRGPFLKSEDGREMSSRFLGVNRNKRSVAMDLRNPRCKEAFEEMVRNSDVLLDNWGPGAFRRLGLGYDHLSEINPGMVYASITGYGDSEGLSGPYSDRPANNMSIQAMAGWMEITGDPEGGPHSVGDNIGDSVPGVWTALGIVLALETKRKTGRGQHVDMAMYDCMFSHMEGTMNVFRATGEVPTRSRERLANAGITFRAKDGYVVMAGVRSEARMRELWKLVGREDLLEGDARYLAGPGMDGQFYYDHIIPAIEGWSMGVPKFQVAATLTEIGFSMGVTQTMADLAVCPQLEARQMFVETGDDLGGTFQGVKTAARLTACVDSPAVTAPLLGEHTAEILAKVNDGPGRAGTYPEGQGVENIMSALEGIRVLDLCIVLAGPTCGRTLGEFGAEVIKIDDPSRPYDIAGNTDVNRGKRSININLKTKEGLEVFYKLLETADVVVENNRASSLARLGISYDEMKKRKPDIIHASLNAFGYDGPWAERPGWEQLAQATSGIQVRRGGRGSAPKLLPYPMNDYGTGLMGAYAVALAVHERNRTGQGQTVNSGLALTAGLLQSPYFLDYEGYQRDEPEGLGVRGFSAKSRLYRAADGWLYFHCPSDEAWKQLTALSDFAGLDNSGDDTLTKSLAEVLTSRPREEWEKLINPTGVSVIANRQVAEFRDDADIRKAGLIVGRDHPGVGQADHLGSVAKLSKTPMRVGRPTPLLGAETDEILIEAGYTGEEIESMKLSGAVVQHQV